RRLVAAEAVLAAQPVSGLFLLAVALEDQNELDRAEEILLRAWRRDPGDFWVNNELGYIRKSKKEGLPFYTAALALRPRSHLAHNNLGTALHDSGQLDRAITEYREALRLKPDFSWAHNNLGHAFMKQGKRAEAIDEYHKALQIEPDFVM